MLYNKQTYHFICLQFLFNFILNFDYFMQRMKRSDIQQYCDPQNPLTLVFLKSIDSIKQYELWKSYDSPLPNFIFLSQPQSANMMKFSIISMVKQPISNQIMVPLFCKLAKKFIDSQADHEIKKIDCFQSKFKVNTDPKPSQILRQYTKQSFFHKFVNNFLRVGADPFELYYLQYPVKFLHLAIKQTYNSYVKIERRQFKCFRGSKIISDQLYMLSKHKGSFIENLGFLSTSLSQKVAQNFGSVLIQISVKDKFRDPEVDFGYAFLEDFTVEKGENQILFNCLSTFKIENVDIKQNSARIKLQYIRAGEIRQKEKLKLKLSVEQKNYLPLFQYQASILKFLTNQGTMLRWFYPHESIEFWETLKQLTSGNACFRHLQSSLDLNIYCGYQQQFSKQDRSLSFTNRFQESELANPNILNQDIGQLTFRLIKLTTILTQKMKNPNLNDLERIISLFNKILQTVKQKSRFIQNTPLFARTMIVVQHTQIVKQLHQIDILRMKGKRYETIKREIQKMRQKICLKYGNSHYYMALINLSQMSLENGSANESQILEQIKGWNGMDISLGLELCQAWMRIIDQLGIQITYQIISDFYNNCSKQKIKIDQILIEKLIQVADALQKQGRLVQICQICHFLMQSDIQIQRSHYQRAQNLKKSVSQIQTQMEIIYQHQVFQHIKKLYKCTSVQQFEQFAIDIDSLLQNHSKTNTSIYLTDQMNLIKSTCLEIIGRFEESEFIMKDMIWK